MKRLCVGLLCLGMAMSFFACSEKGQDAALSVKGQVKYASLPLTKEKTKFTVFHVMGGAGNVTSTAYADNSFTRYVTDATGIEFEFISAFDADSKERINTLLSTGDYPDLFIGEYFNTNDLNYYGEEGIFLPLDEYNALLYPNIAGAFAGYPGLQNMLSGNDGRLYALPRINSCIQCEYQIGRAWYHMPWIRDNGRKVPETTDALRDYLRWIRDNDVNGNGDRNDEVPMAWESGDFWNVLPYFAKAWLPWLSGGIAVYDGKVVEQYRLPEFREALQYLAGLYQEGLIKEDSFTMSGDQLKTLAQSPVNRLGILLTSWQQVMTGSGERMVHTFNLPMLTGPRGKRYGANAEPWYGTGAGMVVTKNCKNPELAVALGNFLLSSEVALRGSWGEKDIAWAEADSASYNVIGGQPALYKVIMTDDKRKNDTWGYHLPQIFDQKLRQGLQVENVADAMEWIKSGNPALLDSVLGHANEYMEVMFNYTPLLQKDIIIPPEYFVPVMRMTEADTTRLSDVNAVVSSYLNQAWVEFIIGKRDINSDNVWNAYIADLDRMSSPELASIRQKYIK